VISDRWAPVSPSGTLDGFVWRTPDERIAAPAEAPAPAPAPPAPAPPAPSGAIAAPPPAPVLTPEPVERAPAPTLVPPPRTGVIIDPASMAPDDPGPGQHEAKRRGFRLYANE
jgi:uncharacterized membrane-anchored protein